MTQRFRKIKYDGDTVELTWIIKHNADIYTHRVTSPGKPRDAFPGALAAFVPTVLKLMEWPDDYRHGLRIRGLSIGEGKDDDGRNLIITCQKHLGGSDAPAISNTPLIKEADTGEIGRLLNQAEEEATQFLRGERFLLSLLTDVEAAERDRAQSGITFAIDTATTVVTDEQIRNSLEGIGLVIALSDIRAWTPDERAAAVTWIGSAVAAKFGAATVADEPLCIERTTMSHERLGELLELGPHVIQSAGDDAFEIMHRDTKEVVETLVDRTDAEVMAAQLNRFAMLNTQMLPEDVEQWVSVGPWSPCEAGKVDAVRYWIESGTQKERAESRDDAWARAARYNRTISTREWTESAQKPNVTDDMVQSVKAAAEAGAVE